MIGCMVRTEPLSSLHLPSSVQLAFSISANSLYFAVAIGQRWLPSNASCPCKSDHDAVHEGVMSQRICKVPQWMPRAWLTGQVIGSQDDDLYLPVSRWIGCGILMPVPCTSIYGRLVY